MDEFTIYCTEEQTKKAIELGATLEFIPMFMCEDNSLPKFVNKKCHAVVLHGSSYQQSPSIIVWA